MCMRKRSAARKTGGVVQRALSLEALLLLLLLLLPEMLPQQKPTPHYTTHTHTGFGASSIA
jgi:hypothetical protein